MKYKLHIRKELIELIKLGVIKKTDSTIVYEKFNSIFEAGVAIGRKCSTQNHRSPVAQYDEKMRFIKRWRTVAACAEDIGYSKDWVHRCTRDRKLTGKGYFIKVNKTAKS